MPMAPENVVVVASLPGKLPRVVHILPQLGVAACPGCLAGGPGRAFPKIGTSVPRPPWVLPGPRVAPAGTLAVWLGGGAVETGIGTDIRVWE